MPPFWAATDGRAVLTHDAAAFAGFAFDRVSAGILQVRGRSNRGLDAATARGRMKTAVQILRRWAEQSRLTIVCRL